MCWVRLEQVGCELEQMVAVQNLASLLERGFLRSSEPWVCASLLERAFFDVSLGSSENSCTRACVYVSEKPEGWYSSLERGFCRSSERALCFVFLRSSENSCARAYFCVADLKLCIVRSSDASCSQARFFCFWSFERPLLRSSKVRIYQLAAACYTSLFIQTLDPAASLSTNIPCSRSLLP
ncbi:hypothetical protein CsSME_00037152 [Camellia sinensis var. sinensis]